MTVQVSQSGLMNIVFVDKVQLSPIIISSLEHIIVSVHWIVYTPVWFKHCYSVTYFKEWANHINVCRLSVILSSFSSIKSLKRGVIVGQYMLKVYVKSY